jgi:hypothetical protein
MAAVDAELEAKKAGEAIKPSKRSVLILRMNGKGLR